AAVSLLIAGAYALIPSHSAHLYRNEVKCASNLRQLGQACLLYASENGGQYPGRLEDVLRTQDVTPTLFLCPSSSDTPAPGPDPETQASGLTTGGHCSYLYFGRGMRDKSVTA